MSIRDRIQKAASIVLSSVGQTFAQPYFWTYSDLDTVTAKSGVSLSNQSALQVSAYFAAVSLLAQTVGQLPLILYERLDPRGKQRAQNHQLYHILHSEPNPYMSAYTFKETLEGHLASWGNAYAEIEWDLSSGWDNRTVESLWPLRPDRMEVMWDKGAIVYQYTMLSGEQFKLKPEQVLHIPGFGFDGLVGYDPLTIAREPLGLAKGMEEFGARFFANGSALNGVLQHPGPQRLSKEATELMRTSWEGMHKGLTNSHRIAILQEGVTYKEVGIAPENAQFLESRKFQVAEIARIMHVPLHMLGDLERSTNNNIEEQALEFVQYTMMPWLVRWEQEVTRKLLPESQRKVYFAEFLVDGLLRGNSQARGDYYTKLFQIGALSPNDAREKENLNPVEGGDEYYVPLNMMPVSMAAIEPTEPGKPAVAAEGDTAENIAEGEKLNGIQIQAANQVIADLVNGLIPALVALELLVAVGIDRDRAQAMIDACKDFTPAAQPDAQQTTKLLGMLGLDVKARGKRGAMHRAKAAASYKAAFVRAAAPIVRYEIREVGKAAKLHLKTAKAFDKWLSQFYGDAFKVYVVKRMTPVMRALAEAVFPLASAEVNSKEPMDEAKLKAYIDGFADRYMAVHKGQMAEAMKQDDPVNAVSEALDAWSEVAADRVATAETVGLGNAIAKLAFLGAGIRTLRWIAVGSDNCPACQALDGQTVTTLSPPLHEGCICQLGPW